MKHQKAQSLIELLIALGVFVLIVTAINFLSLDTYIADRAGGERTQATFLAKEGIEAAKSIGDNSWDDLSLGSHGLNISDGNWIFQGTEDGIISRTLYFRQRRCLFFRPSSMKSSIPSQLLKYR